MALGVSPQRRLDGTMIFLEQLKSCYSNVFSVFAIDPSNVYGLDQQVSPYSQDQSPYQLGARLNLC